MSRITVIATVTARVGHIDRVKKELLKLVDVSRAEAGCIDYFLHQDNDNPAYFLFYENWESCALWQKHMDSRHVLDFIDTMVDALEGFSMHEMSKLS